jgi:hypothetical protein
MPVIQQERGQRTIKGLPPRWGARAYRELSAARAGQTLGEMPGRYTQLAALLDTVTNAPLPIDATDAQLCILAERSAGECSSMAQLIHDPKALRARLAWMVANRGLTPPQVSDDRQFMLRCIDSAWWRRNLRTVHGRAFEHAAVRLGFVSLRAGAYASNETVARHAAAKARNARTLANVTMSNEHGDEFTLAELALTSVSNKSNRRKELMLRMKGCEEIANDMGDAGVFVTLTCPSKFHAVLAKSGTVNPNYNGLNAQAGQAYLANVWACIRSALHRKGVSPYGFRIAEPHHDGCPHWHMLLFVPKHKVRRLRMTINAYALAEDGDEPGAKRNRVKIIRIEASKGTAAGYIAKYVGKNIDGEHVGVTLDRDGQVVPAVELAGEEIIKPAQRVEAWASTWGIRQFQPIGQPPVTVWRELRRVPAEQVQDAPEHVRAAWEACQRERTTDLETGEVVTERAASYSAYIRAQGGVNRGRNYRIGLLAPVELREGRYGLAERPMPKGVYCKSAPDMVYASTRYEWKRSCVAAPNGSPWTRVNNCTVDPASEAPKWEASAIWQSEYPPHDDAEYFANFDFSYFDSAECRKHYLKE